MKACILFFMLLTASSTLFSQQLTVLDEETRRPIESAEILSQDLQMSILTDTKGTADIESLQEAKSITVRALGYKTKTQTYVQLEEMEFVVSLEPHQLHLDEIVVSATRWQQRTSNIPAKISSISPEDNLLQNPQSAADLLDISGKVFIQKSQQGGGSPMIRGFATNRLIYTVDGVRMNTAIFRGGNIQNVINMDPFAVESTEVLFGPGSVIYGSDAIGGVMSFQTLQPKFSSTEKTSVSGSALGRFSSANNERTGHLHINVGGKKWAVISSISSWDYDHLRQGRYGPDDYLNTQYIQRQNGMDVVITQNDPTLQIPSAYSQLNLMQKVRYQPNANWNFTYGFHYSATSSFGRFDRLNRMQDGRPQYAEWKYGPQKWLMNHLAVEHTSSSRWFDQMSLRVAQQSFEESRIDRTFGLDERRNREEKVDAYSANLDFTKQLATEHTLFYGAEYVRNDVQSHSTITNIVDDTEEIGPSRYPESDWSSFALYLSHEWRTSDRFTLHSGVRYNHFLMHADFASNRAFYPFPFRETEINNGALTGSLGGVYRPSDRWVFKANLGTAFRAPNVDDIGKVFDSEPGAVVVPNPDLQAEYAYNVDMGAARLLGDAIKLDLTLYYTQLQNAQVRRNFSIDGRDSILYDDQLSQVQALQNAATAYVYGIQGGLEIHFPYGIQLLSDINYQRGREEMDDGSISPSRHAPPLFGINRLRYKSKSLTLELNHRYQGAFTHDQLSVSERTKTEIYALDADGNTFAPAWHTLNFKARVTLSDSWSLSSGVENITDQRYRPYSSGISGPGRNFILSVNVDF